MMLFALVVVNVSKGRLGHGRCVGKLEWNEILKMYLKNDGILEI